MTSSIYYHKLSLLGAKLSEVPLPPLVIPIPMLLIGICIGLLICVIGLTWLNSYDGEDEKERQYRIRTEIQKRSTRNHTYIRVSK